MERKVGLMLGTLTGLSIGVLTTFVPLTACATADAPRNMHLFLLGGQSNMSGRGTLSETNRIDHERVLVMTPSGGWRPAVEPFHWEKPKANGAGLAASFARAYADAHPGTTVGLVPVAYGGSSIRNWQPGRVHYTNAVAYARQAMRQGEFKGFLWHQGESDAFTTERVMGYVPLFTNAINRLRQELGIENVPFIAGELGPYLKDWRDKKRPNIYWQEMNAEIARGVKLLPHAALVSSAGLYDVRADRIHFETPSLRRFGLRYYSAYAGLQPSGENRFGDERLRFGVISDIHITTEKQLKYFKKALQQLDAVKVDAVMCCGDIADFGLELQLQMAANVWFEVFPGNRSASDGREVVNLMHYGDHDMGGERYVDRPEAVERWPDRGARLSSVLNPNLTTEEAIRHAKKAWERCFKCSDWDKIVIRDVKGYKFVLAHFTRGEEGNPVGNNVPGLADFLAMQNLQGDKPFFYSQHRVPKQTASGPTVWGQDDGTTTRILSGYPNAIAFCGHAHENCVQENSIWQGAFTCVQVPSLRYNCVLSGRENGYVASVEAAGDHDGEKYCMRRKSGPSGQGYVCHVYDRALVIERFQLLSGKHLGPDWVVPFAEFGLPVGRCSLSVEARTANDPAPEFTAGASVSVGTTFAGKDRGYGKGTKTVPSERHMMTPVRFPVARSTPTTPRANDYEVAVEMRRDEGILVGKVKYVYSPGFYGPEDEEAAPVRCDFSEAQLPTAGEYRFRVTPRNVWGRKGKSIYSQWLKAAESTGFKEGDDAVNPQVGTIDRMQSRIVTDLSGSGWTCDGVPVVVPHTWNALDAADGPCGCFTNGCVNSAANEVSYVRKRALYRRELPNAREGRRYFLKCEGASIRADVKVNGHDVGAHVGAFTSFGFEITKYLQSDKNVLEIAVDNSRSRDTQPLSADYSVFGGLYRGVWLIETGRVCIDPVTDGANGVCVMANPTNGDVSVKIRVLGGTNEIHRFHVDGYKLWSPETPYLYSRRITIAQGGCVDAVDVRFGFRTVEFREDGFYLNGCRRQLRGVNRHQDREGKGWALSKLDETEDIRLIKELGADALRTAHYQQSQHVYDLCDELGLVCWVEHPNNVTMSNSDEFMANSNRQIREMVAQLSNHPSVAMWSIWNELRVSGGDSRIPGVGSKRADVLDCEDAKRILIGQRDLFRMLDLDRPVVAATDKPWARPINDISDQLAYNRYPQWYSPATMREMLSEMFSADDRCILGMSEYGAGGSAVQHDDPLLVVSPRSRWHPEERQAYLLHDDLLALQSDSRIWGHFVWALFDFGSDSRMEGEKDGINDKGLITYDRQTKKDAYYLYRAAWSKIPTLHLVGSRMTTVTNDTMNILGFSNVGDVTLLVNEREIGRRAPDEVGGVFWSRVKLTPGENKIELRAGAHSSRAVWRRLTVKTGNE